MTKGYGPQAKHSMILKLNKKLYIFVTNCIIRGHNKNQTITSRLGFIGIALSARIDLDFDSLSISTSHPT